jgi:tetratricopeptide (TPR) repeat protein
MVRSREPWEWVKWRRRTDESPVRQLGSTRSRDGPLRSGGLFWAVSSGASPAQTQVTFSELHQQCWDLLYEGKYAEAEPPAQRLYRWAEQRAAAKPSQWVDASNTLGDVYRCLARYDEAEPLHRRALETARSRLGEQDPKVAQSLHKLGLLSYAQGRYAEAEPFHQQALEIRRERFGELSADVAESLNNLAELYQEQARYTEAEALHRQVLEIRRKLLDDCHPSMASSYFSLADVYRKRNDYSQADRYFRKAFGKTLRTVMVRYVQPETLQRLMEEADRGGEQPIMPEELVPEIISLK